MNPLKKLIFGGPEKTVQITLNRNVRLKNAAGEMIDGVAGEIHDVTPKVAEDLFTSGAAIDNRNDAAIAAKVQRLAPLMPVIEQPAPVPESYANLPECFTRWWKLHQQLQVQIDARDETERRLIASHQIGMNSNDLRSITEKSGIHWTKMSKLMGAAHIGMFAHQNDPQLEETRVFLREKYEELKSRVESSERISHAERTRAHHDCSQATIAENGKVVRACRDLAALGRELFAVRIGALGLGEHQTDVLFQGSADAVKYKIQAPSLQDLRLAWSEADRDPVYFIDRSPATMAETIFGWRTILAEVDFLTKQAKKELAAARKVAA